MTETPAATKQPRPRPISPHLQIYRPQLTSVMSILHRITGVVMSLGSVIIVLWLAAAALPDTTYYSLLQSYITSTVGILIMFGWSWAVFYHMANGIRHLLWDMGYGFEIKTVYKSGYIAVLASFILTVVLWYCASAI